MYYFFSSVFILRWRCNQTVISCFTIDKYVSTHNPLPSPARKEKLKKSSNRSSVFKRPTIGNSALVAISSSPYNPRSEKKDLSPTPARKREERRRNRSERNEGKEERDDITLARGVGHETRSTWRRRSAPRIPSVPIDARNLHLNHARVVCVYLHEKPRAPARKSSPYVADG